MTVFTFSIIVNQFFWANFGERLSLPLFMMLQINSALPKKCWVGFCVLMLIICRAHIIIFRKGTGVHFVPYISLVVLVKTMQFTILVFCLLMLYNYN